MTDSVFTKIIKRELPAEIIYENDDFAAILSIHPHADGETVIFPKSQEYTNFWSMNADLLAQMMTLAQKLAQIILSELKPARVGLMFEGFGVADHVHLSLIPINRPGDIDDDKAHPARPEELAQTAARLRPLMQKVSL